MVHRLLFQTLCYYPCLLFYRHYIYIYIIYANTHNYGIPPYTKSKMLKTYRQIIKTVFNLYFVVCFYASDQTII